MILEELEAKPCRLYVRFFDRYGAELTVLPCLVVETGSTEIGGKCFQELGVFTVGPQTSSDRAFACRGQARPRCLMDCGDCQPVN
jgi:hypothetical protein